MHLQGSPSVESSVAEKQQQQQQQNPESQDDQVDAAEESSLSQRQCGEGLSCTDRKARRPRPWDEPGLTRAGQHRGLALHLRDSLIQLLSPRLSNSTTSPVMPPLRSQLEVSTPDADPPVLISPGISQSEHCKTLSRETSPTGSQQDISSL